MPHPGLLNGPRTATRKIRNDSHLITPNFSPVKWKLKWDCGFFAVQVQKQMINFGFALVQSEASFDPDFSSVWHPQLNTGRNPKKKKKQTKARVQFGSPGTVRSALNTENIFDSIGGNVDPFSNRHGYCAQNIFGTWLFMRGIDKDSKERIPAHNLVCYVQFC